MKKEERIKLFISIAIFIVFVTLAILRMTCFEELIDTTTIVLFALAFLPWVGIFIKNFKYKDFEVGFNRKHENLMVALDREDMLALSNSCGENIKENDAIKYLNQKSMEIFGKYDACPRAAWLRLRVDLEDVMYRIAQELEKNGKHINFSKNDISIRKLSDLLYENLFLTGVQRRFITLLQSVMQSASKKEISNRTYKKEEMKEAFNSGKIILAKLAYNLDSFTIEAKDKTPNTT